MLFYKWHQRRIKPQQIKLTSLGFGNYVNELGQVEPRIRISFHLVETCGILGTGKMDLSFSSNEASDLISRLQAELDRIKAYQEKKHTCTI